jgi:PAS domain S-box-containing protein
MTGEKPLKILHVDDEENQLEFTKIFLEQIEKDVIVDSVKDPKEALKKQEKENYDCIVSDYKMMSMNGIELAQKVREKSDVPFILYTGQGSEEVAELAFSSGVDDYLRKETEPTHYQVLAKRIKHTVEKHRTEELYRKVVEESRDAIVIVVENKVAFLNQAACNMVGVNTVDDCIGMDIFELFQEDTEKVFMPKLEKKESQLVSINYKTRQGNVKNAEISVSKINYRGDAAYLCFIRDITDRKRNEQRLNAIYLQASKLSTAFSVEEISETTLDIMENVFENHILTFHTVEGDNLKTLGTRGDPLIELSVPLTGPGLTTKVARETQSMLILDLSECSDFVRGNSKSGSELAVPAILSNETIAVLNAESLDKDAFTEADLMLLEMLAYHVSFAFNRIQTEKLKEKEGEEKRKRLDYALGVLDNAERATALVREELQRSILSILNASGILRIQPEMLPKMIDAIDEHADEAHVVSELIKEIVSQSATIKGYVEVNQKIRNLIKEKYIPRNIRVRTQYDSKLLLVEIEEEKFSRVLNNLIDNAIEAMTDGGSLSFRITGMKDKVNIDITDTGIGIPENKIDIIFEPFNSTKAGHSGLGLAYSKNAVESIGGSIRVLSTGKNGSIFRLSLPLQSSR